MPLNPVTGFMTPDNVYTNCDIRNYVRAYGLQLGSPASSGIAYITDTCATPAGFLVMGPASLAIGAVGSQANKLAQRDPSGRLNASSFQVESVNCGQDGSLMYAGVNGSDGIRVGRVGTGNVFNSEIFLRGNGDVPVFGGNAAAPAFGGFQIRRAAGQNEGVTFQQYGSPHTHADLTMLFRSASLQSGLTQSMMLLQPNAPRGTLYDTAWTYVSDAATKENIEAIDPLVAIEIVKQLQPRTFNMIGEGSARRQAGYIAQEIQAIPELAHLVSTTPPGKGEDSPPLLVLRKDSISDGYLAAAVQGLIAQIETLQAEVEALKAEAEGNN